MLSAFELSQDSMFLDQATKLVDSMMPVFKPGQDFPRATFNFKTREAGYHNWAKNKVLLAEIGSIQMEYFFLSYHTGNPK